MEKKEKKMVMLITNHDDDVYCFRKELIEAIVENGYRMLISCPYGEKLDLMQEIPYEYDNPIIDRRGTNVWSDFKLMLHYRKVMKQYKPDVVLCYTAKPNVYGSLAARSLKIPYINNVTGLGSVLSKGTLMKNFVLTLFKIAFSKSSCIFFQNSENMKLAKKQGMVKGYCELIPGSGVNTTRFGLQEYPNGGNGTEGEKVIFNYIGRVLHDKGVDDYIEAAKIVKAQWSNTEFNIIGFIEPTENHYKELLEQLEKEEIVYYRGSQKDIKPFIARSHATIHPSTYGEGMSNVLLESAASGRVLITTDNPGCRETVEHEKTGFIYPGGNVSELVCAIKKFLHLTNEERKLMGKQGREKVKKEFSRELVIQAYLKQIKKVD